MADLRRNLERQMLVSQVQRAEILDKISVTDEEAKAYFDEHRQNSHRRRSHLREILIEVKNTDRGVNVAEDDAAREQAQEIRKRLLAGEPFPRLAGVLVGRFKGKRWSNRTVEQCWISTRPP